MANGDRKQVRMDSEHMGNKGRGKRRNKDEEKGMEKMEKGENTEGGRQGGGINKDQEKD